MTPMQKDILGIMALILLHSLLLLTVNQSSVLIWGNPHGLSFGITLVYCFWLLCFLGAGLIILFRIFRPKIAFAASIVLIAFVAYTISPGFFTPIYYSMFAGSFIFFSLLWFVKEGHLGRRIPNGGRT